MKLLSFYNIISTPLNQYSNQNPSLPSVRLRKGEVVGFERFDDVDLTTSEENGYYQLKHTTRKGTNGYKNMSPKDADFWKTIHV